MIIPMFIPSRWVRPAVAAPVPAFGSFGPAMGGADPAQTYSSFPETTVDGGLLADWERTRPQAQIDPGPPQPGQSQAPWDRNEFG